MRSLLTTCLLSLCGLAVAAWAAPQPERQQELLHLLKHDCGSCHGMTLKGGLGPALTPTALQGRPRELLVQTILQGRPETAMPPWQGQLSHAEAQWLVERLVRGETGEP